MIPYDSGDLLTLLQAAQELPGRPHVSTLHRWAARQHAPRLETIVIGGKRFTSRQAIQQFVEEGTAAAEPTPARLPAAAKRRERSIAQAEIALSDL